VLVLGWLMRVAVAVLVQVLGWLRVLLRVLVLVPI
jgi:hypothetical protein